MKCLRETDGSVGLVGSLLFCFISKQILAYAVQVAQKHKTVTLTLLPKSGIIVTGFMPF